MDMVDIAKSNDGGKNVLVAIDIFSRLPHCRPIKSKKGEDEPEIFPALNFKIKGVNFCCFHTGKVVITGI